MTVSAKSLNFVERNITFSDMGLGTYWARKDDQSGEIKTVKPWEEEVSNGDKFFPDPKGKKESPLPTSPKEEE